MEKFHWYNQKNQKTLIDATKLNIAASDLGFRSFKEKEFLFINPDKSCKECDLAFLKREIIQHIVEEEPFILAKVIESIQVQSPSIFKKERFRDYLTPVEFNGLRDTKYKVHQVFSNGIAIISKDAIIFEPLGMRLHWEASKKQRSFKPVTEDEYKQSDFYRFCMLLSKNDMDRMHTLMSAIGFLISNYKDLSYCPAIILNDEADSVHAEGRTGKGLICKVVAEYVKRFLINAKTLDKLDKFHYQEYQDDIGFIHLDDCTESFDFSAFFSELTEGFSYEQKGLKKIRVPYHLSPKYAITTNKVIAGLGTSQNDRRFEIELANYFSPTFRPFDVFKRDFIQDWDESEWYKTDGFIFACVQLFLQRGLIPCAKSEFNDLKKLRQNTAGDFPDWADRNLLPNINLYVDEIYDSWQEENKRSKVTRRTFYQWCREYANMQSWKTLINLNKTGKNNGKVQNYFLFSDSGKTLFEDFKQKSKSVYENF